MEIKAELVKKLRDQTSVSMMECKRALIQANGDLAAAIELLRKSGEATALKKQTRLAKQGLVVIVPDQTNSQGVVLEINCETDFVAKNQKILEFAQQVATIALQTQILAPAQLQLQHLPDGQTIEQGRATLIGQLGENLILRRVEAITASSPQEVLGWYLHGGTPTKIASIVCLANSNQELARDLAMHVAAMRPEFVTAAEIPKDRYTKEAAIFMEQTKLNNKDKPEDLLQKIAIGRVTKFFKEITLVDQAFVKDPQMSVGELLAKHKAKIVKVVRFEVGEGIEEGADQI